MPVKVTAWKCEHCNMTSVYEANVKRHERRTCQKAPGACATCEFFAVQDEYEGTRLICNNPESPVYHELDNRKAESWGILGVKRTACEFWQALEVKSGS